MPDFKNGKIYIIKSNETKDVYIGSTCSSLKQRFSAHKSEYKRVIKEGETRKCSSMKILKYPDACIELLEYYHCDSRKELYIREGEIIKNTPHCINKTIQGRTMEQWRIDKAEHCKNYSDKYRKENRDLLLNKLNKWKESEKGKDWAEKYNEKRREKCICANCGVTVSRGSLQYHQKSNQCEKNKNPPKNFVERMKEIVECSKCGAKITRGCLKKHQGRDVCQKNTTVKI